MTAWAVRLIPGRVMLGHLIIENPMMDIGMFLFETFAAI
jgi:hypothetical protein